MAHQSFTDRVAAHFQQRPGVWVDSRDLERIGGRMAWRTRVSDCRKPISRGGRYEFNIENRQRQATNRGGEPYIISEYRYSPPVPARLPLWDDVPVAPI